MADIIDFERKPEPNIHITQEMQDLMIELMFGIYDITMITSKQPVDGERAKRAGDTLAHMTGCVKEHDPENIIDFMTALIKPKTVSGDTRYILMYNECVRLKAIFVKERKATLN